MMLSCFISQNLLDFGRSLTAFRLILARIHDTSLASWEGQARRFAFFFASTDWDGVTWIGHLVKRACTFCTLYCAWHLASCFKLVLMLSAVFWFAEPKFDQVAAFLGISFVPTRIYQENDQWMRQNMSKSSGKGLKLEGFCCKDGHRSPFSPVRSQKLAKDLSMTESFERSKTPEALANNDVNDEMFWGSECYKKCAQPTWSTSCPCSCFVGLQSPSQFTGFLNNFLVNSGWTWDCLKWLKDLEHLQNETKKIILRKIASKASAPNLNLKPPEPSRQAQSRAVKGVAFAGKALDLKAFKTEDAVKWKTVEFVKNS